MHFVVAALYLLDRISRAPGLLEKGIPQIYAYLF
jgi:hypothetical protein